MRKILVGITCYNNHVEIINYLNEICKQKIEGFNLFIAITCNNEESYHILENYINNNNFNGVFIYLFNANANLGYLNACLFGIEKVLIQIKRVEWIMISNTDISFDENDFFYKYSNITFDENIWCVGPAIIDSTNNNINPYKIKRPSYYKLLSNYLFYYNIYTYRFFRFLVDLKHMIPKQNNTTRAPSCYTYSVHGCAFFITMECYSELIKKSKNIFMYCEENLISEIIYENTKKEYYWADSLIYHNESQTTSLVLNDTRREWRKNSIKYIVDNFYKIAR